jgi:hypothetical protein
MLCLVCDFRPVLPQYAVSEKNTPANIAIALRKKWDITEAVIGNLTQLIERHGIIISSFDFGTERVDSRSILTDNKQPIIVINKVCWQTGNDFHSHTNWGIS